MPSAKCAPFDLNLAVPDGIRQLAPYVPGKSIEEAKREFGLNEVAKLASNENPLGPSPGALQAISAAMTRANRYPDASYRDLKSAIAEKRDLEPVQVCIGAGSNELIDLLIRAFCPKGSNVVVPRLSFIAYKLCAQINGVRCKEAPIGGDYSVSAESILGAVDAETRMVFLANPNNPTGAMLPRDEVAHLAAGLAKQSILLILDYAYWEYAGAEDFPPAGELLGLHANTVVLQTFSKIYGLAGLRVGYGLARSEVIQWVERARQPFNASSVGCEGAMAALEDAGFTRRAIEANQRGRAQLEKGLEAMGVRAFPSKGNFLLIDVGRGADQVYLECLKRGVIVRPLANYGLREQLRVSVGTERDNEKFLEALKGALA